ncbi:MAG: M16 family metallopeptidase, partial [Deferrisomatales bacterium]
GFQSRLVREIRSNRGLAYSVGSFYQALPGFGVVGVQATTKRESAAQVLGLLRSVPEEAARGGVAPDELEAGRQALVTRHAFRYEDPAAAVRERLALRLDGLALDLPAQYPGRIDAVTPAEVASALGGPFASPGGITVVVGDVDPADPAWAGRGAVEVVPGR